MKTILMTLATLLCAMTLCAQPPQGGRMMGANMDPAEKALKMTDMLKQKLALTDDQATRIQQIFTDSFTREKALMDQLRQEETNRQAAMNKILTPEQQAKLAQEQQQMQQREPQHHRQGNAKPQ